MSTADLALVIPAAGRGSRFGEAGIALPKPLIELHGRPFLWWSAHSVLRAARVRELVFVVLREHVRDHAIDRRILDWFPQARVVVVEQVTAGAAQTAAIGVAALSAHGPVAINDCDHAFASPPLDGVLDRLRRGAAGALMSFRSRNPAYSYLKLDAQGRIQGTVEKQVVSEHAIAGCYLFADSAGFEPLLRDYALECPYPELFVSGMFDLLARRGLAVERVDLQRHVPFGTVQELERATAEAFGDFLDWH